MVVVVVFGWLLRGSSRLGNPLDILVRFVQIFRIRSGHLLRHVGGLLLGVGCRLWLTALIWALLDFLHNILLVGG